ncbi:hypothetical protein FA13DRAFT_981377 [Coprinellus micaceus]|uniref:Uncharacterized protein n=1 Tax=Coprinellus micaceus TaxID=71717 RepID=A0A4Y7RTG4_COPMI|nr:hypothetical protein FA13DRAFT_981377 [Coprinellus micaceus]
MIFVWLPRLPVLALKFCSPPPPPAATPPARVRDSGCSPSPIGMGLATLSVRFGERCAGCAWWGTYNPPPAPYHPAACTGAVEMRRPWICAGSMSSPSPSSSSAFCPSPSSPLVSSAVSPFCTVASWVGMSSATFPSPPLVFLLLPSIISPNPTPSAAGTSLATPASNNSFVAWLNGGGAFEVPKPKSLGARMGSISIPPELPASEPSSSSSSSESTTRLVVIVQGRAEASSKVEAESRMRRQGLRAPRLQAHRGQRSENGPINIIPTRLRNLQPHPRPHFRQALSCFHFKLPNNHPPTHFGVIRRNNLFRAFAALPILRQDSRVGRRNLALARRFRSVAKRTCIVPD